MPIYLLFAMRDISEMRIKYHRCQEKKTDVTLQFFVQFCRVT